MKSPIKSLWVWIRLHRLWQHYKTYSNFWMIILSSPWTTMFEAWPLNVAIPIWESSCECIVIVSSGLFGLNIVKFGNPNSGYSKFDSKMRENESRIEIGYFLNSPWLFWKMFVTVCVRHTLSPTLHFGIALAGQKKKWMNILNQAINAATMNQKKKLHEMLTIFRMGDSTQFERNKFSTPMWFNVRWCSETAHRNENECNKRLHFYNWHHISSQ